MDPVLIGRPALAIVGALLLLCLVIFPMQDKGTVEYWILLVSMVINFFLFVGLIIWIRRKSKEARKERGDEERRNVGTWERGNLGTWELGNEGTRDEGTRNEETEERGNVGT